MCLPSIFLLATWYFLPESPRYLIHVGKLEEAEQILREGAKVNGKEANIPDDFSSMLESIHDGVNCFRANIEALHTTVQHLIPNKF